MRKTIILGSLIIAAVLMVPWTRFGKPDSVTVNGEAKTTVKNQIASFYAGIMANNDKKELAISEANTKAADIIKAVKNFGIKNEDIKTQSVGVYQDEQAKDGQWIANNSIEITLRNIDQAGQLADLLNATKANNVSGPNFRTDDTTEVENSLYGTAMKDARTKAELIAKTSGRRLGKVIMVVDGGGANNVYPMMNKADIGGAGVPIETGSATVSKSMTVTFELK